MGILSQPFSKARTAAATIAGLALLAGWRLTAGSDPHDLTLGGGQIWRIERPGWLVLLLALPYLILYRPLPGRGRKPGRLLLGLRLGWTGLLVLALSGLAWQRPQDDISLVALVDGSASIADADLGRAGALVSRLEREIEARAPGTRLSVVRFARFPVELMASELTGNSSRPPTLFRVTGDAAEETDLASAVGFGLARLDPGRIGRLLLLSDGRATRGDLLAQAERARRRGIPIFVTDLPARAAPPAPDVGIAALDGPTTIQPGASFELEARVVASHPGKTQFRLQRDGEPADAGESRQVELSVGINLVRFTARLGGEKANRYRIQALPGPTNQEPRNDHAVLAIAPQPRARILVLEAIPDTTLAFRRALLAERFETEVALWPALPSWERLSRFDLVVLSDFGVFFGGRPGEDQPQLANLERFVRERGGGLLVAGSADGGDGSVRRGRFEALLPVVYDSSEQKQEATLALALVIDRSGSMSGPKMDLTKEAARGAAELMDPHDLITVVTFDSQAQTVVRLQPASNRQRILSDIAQIRASGGTNVLPGLQEAFDQLLSARAKKKHAIVLSDGQSPADGVRELVDEAAGGGITVSAVGVGDGADLALLQTVAARGGGRFYHTRDPASIPRIFTSETAQFAGTNLVETPSRVLPARPAQAIAGLPFISAPPLHGYARARGKKSAEVLLRSNLGDPLLARWRVGLGQVLAWTSDLTSRWSSEWMRWSHFGKFWGQVVRSGLGHQGTEAPLPIFVALEADRALAQVRAFDADDRPLVGLQGDLAVTEVSARGPIPELPTRSLAFSPTGAGVYQAEIPLGRAEAWLLTGELHGTFGGEALHVRAQGRLSIPALRERLPPGAEQAADGPAGPTLLRALAARTGGTEVTEDPRPLLDPPVGAGRRWWPLRPALVLTALVLFLGEIAARRASFRRSGRLGAG